MAATGGTWAALPTTATAAEGRVLAGSDAVRRVEQARLARGTGRRVRASVTAQPVEVDLGGRVVRTWSYGDQVPGRPLRCTAGDLLEVDVRNRLPEPTTVHWHGLRLRNDMDGVPHLTQPVVPPGETMRYTFVAPDPGTYWFHPHVGMQRERGLFAPLIIDDPREAGDYDVEFVVVLDDWIDGAAGTPDEVLSELRNGDMEASYKVPVQAGQIEDRSASWDYHQTAEMANIPAGQTPVSAASRMADSVRYPFYLLNGRLPTAPETFAARPGQRARIRLISAAGTTTFRVALGGHRLTVTHTDGFPVEPITVDNLHIGAGERYDVLVTLGDGAFPLVAIAEGHGAQALGVVRTASGAAPSAAAAPRELSGRLLRLTDLRAAPTVGQDNLPPDVTHTLHLTGDMFSFAWRINAQSYDHARPFAGITPAEIREGQRVRLELVNQTPMYHPMHLHGHSFTVRGSGDLFPGAAAGELRDPARSRLPMFAGAVKDTVMVAPGERVIADFTADNPGQWLTHCHNAYHMGTGMATIVSYIATSSA
ncbi:multicopper oxidase family protein [Blastococcus sp. TF02-8]|uniref:multicopper oxidase family protein n=1 Tax=Blastococcus sp. TF02-8 TaxID=2250574 RepID=UPI000DEB7B06|nr:multicopper oxidase family protein [Blastococcus sp. TF02-8]RBY92516.1 multicopper oxidase family protein [Blastococcus sp. TF02-8]